MVPDLQVDKGRTLVCVESKLGSPTVCRIGILVETFGSVKKALI